MKPIPYVQITGMLGPYSVDLTIAIPLDQIIAAIPQMIETFEQQIPTLAPQIMRAALKLQQALEPVIRAEMERIASER